MLKGRRRLVKTAHLIIKFKDVGGQTVYRKQLELFLLDRAIYVYLWRADSRIDDVIASIEGWMNLLQSCVPGVNVLPVCTHIDCASPADAKVKITTVKKVFNEWSAVLRRQDEVEQAAQQENLHY